VSTIVVAIASDHPFSAITNSLRVLVFAGAIMVAGDVVDIVAAAVVVACAGVGVAVAPGVSLTPGATAASATRCFQGIQPSCVISRTQCHLPGQGIIDSQRPTIIIILQPCSLKARIRRTTKCSGMSKNPTKWSSHAPLTSKLQRIGRPVSTLEIMESPPDDSLFFCHQKNDEYFALQPPLETRLFEYSSSLEWWHQGDGGSSGWMGALWGSNTTRGRKRIRIS
jgi:hypothetical protein